MSLYSQYYTASDCLVFLESTNEGKTYMPVLLDKVNDIGYNEMIVTRQIYGIGDPLFGFSPSGVVSVNGSFSIPLTTKDYLIKAIKTATGEQERREDLEPLTFKKFVLMTPEESAKLKAAKAKEASEAIHASSITTLPNKFNIRIVFNNSNPYHEDNEKPSVLLEKVRITSDTIQASTASPDAISNLYSFIAKRVKRL